MSDFLSVKKFAFAFKLSAGKYVLDLLFCMLALVEVTRVVEDFGVQIQAKPRLLSK